MAEDASDGTHPAAAMKYSALWIMQSTTGLKPMDRINKSGLIKGSEVCWPILQSQIVIRPDYTGFNPELSCYMVLTP